MPPAGGDDRACPSSAYQSSQPRWPRSKPAGRTRLDGFSTVAALGGHQPVRTGSIGAVEGMGALVIRAQVNLSWRTSGTNRHKYPVMDVSLIDRIVSVCFHPRRSRGCLSCVAYWSARRLPLFLWRFRRLACPRSVSNIMPTMAGSWPFGTTRSRDGRDAPCAPGTHAWSTSQALSVSGWASTLRPFRPGTGLTMLHRSDGRMIILA